VKLLQLLSTSVTMTVKCDQTVKIKLGTRCHQQFVIVTIHCVLLYLSVYFMKPLCIHCRWPDVSTQLLQWDFTRKCSSSFKCSINQTLFPDTRHLPSFYLQQSHQFYESRAFFLVYHVPADQWRMWCDDTMTQLPQVLNHRAELFSWNAWYRM